MGVSTVISFDLESNPYTWIYIVWGFAVITLLLNTFQVYVMSNDRKTRQSKSMVLFFNLSISYVLFALFLATHTSLVHHLTDRNSKLFGTSIDAKRYGEIRELLKPIQTTMIVFQGLTYRFSLLISLLTHVAIACDRLYCVLRPFKYWQLF